MSLTKGSLAMGLTIEETTTSFDSASVIKHDQISVNKTFTPGGTAPNKATKNASFEVALSGGAATIDLTNITDPVNGVVTGNTLKVQAITVKNKATNGAAITIAKGASNGYTGFGSAFSMSIPVGGTMGFDAVNAGATISSTVKTLDLAGSGTDVLQVQILFG